MCGLVLSALSCSSSDADKTQDNNHDRARPPNTTESTTRKSRREIGQVTIVGASSNAEANVRGFQGPPEPDQQGSEAVKCAYYPHGDLNRAGEVQPPKLEILAGFKERWQGQASIFNVTRIEPFTRDVTYSEVLEDQELFFSAHLTHSDPNSYYEYWYFYDPYVSPTVRSLCSVDVTTFTQTRVVGQVACKNLTASPGSKDYAGLADPSPLASATIAFDCPLSIVPRPDLVNKPTVPPDPKPGDPKPTEPIPDPKPAPKKCTGIAAACSSRSATNCAQVKGCSVSRECYGYSSSCYGRTLYSCGSQDGCYWSSLDERCNGSAWSCSSYSSSLSCVGQSGCSWDEDCEGISTSCALLSESECLSQPGCRLE